MPGTRLKDSRTHTASFSALQVRRVKSAALSARWSNRDSMQTGCDLISHCKTKRAGSPPFRFAVNTTLIRCVNIRIILERRCRPVDPVFFLHMSTRLDLSGFSVFVKKEFIDTRCE